MTAAAPPRWRIVRVEQLYPWPERRTDRPSSSATPSADEVVWLQEEPENMGAWSFVHARLHAALPERLASAPCESPRIGQPGHRERRPAPVGAG